MGLVKYKGATLRRLRNVLNHARSKLSAAQRLCKGDIDRKVSFRQVINAGDFVHVGRPPRSLIEAERRDTKRLHGDTKNVSRKFLPKSEEPCCVLAATKTVV